MPYSLLNWANNVAPAINGTNLNHMDVGISKAPYGPDASINQVAYYNGSSWSYGLLTTSQISATAGILKSQLAALGIVDADVTGPIAASKIGSGYALSSLGGYPSDGTKFAAGDGTWKVPTVSNQITSYRKTTSKAVNTTSVATDLLNGEITLAAGIMGTSRQLVGRLWGDYLNNDVRTTGPRFQLVVGGTTIFDTSAFGDSQVSATRGGWIFEISCLELGATNSQVWNIEGFLNLPSDGQAANTTGGNPFTTGPGIVVATYSTSNGAILTYNGTVTTALDMTTSKTFVFNVLNFVANANYETRLLGASVDVW